MENTVQLNQEWNVGHMCLTPEVLSPDLTPVPLWGTSHPESNAQAVTAGMVVVSNEKQLVMCKRYLSNRQPTRDNGQNLLL